MARQAKKREELKREELARERQERERERERKREETQSRPPIPAAVTEQPPVMVRASGARFGGDRGRVLSLLMGLALIPFGGLSMAAWASVVDRQALMRNACEAFAWLGLAIINANPAQPLTSESAEDLLACLKTINEAKKGRLSTP